MIAIIEPVQPEYIIRNVRTLACKCIRIVTVDDQQSGKLLYNVLQRGGLYQEWVRTHELITFEELTNINFEAVSPN